MKLNLGCGDRVIPGFTGVDIADAWVGGPHDTTDGYQQVDLSGPWPWEDSSVEEVLAFDVIEHIGDQHWNRIFIPGNPDTEAAYNWLRAEGQKRHPLGRIHFINELHRVLKPGARATIETPDASRGVGFTQDPTHVSPWCRSTFKYFEHGAFAHTRLSKAYGITAAFNVIEMTALGPMPGEGYGETVWKIRAVLEAVK